MTSTAAALALLIPAHRPPPELPEFVQALAATGRFAAVIVVDDGSGPDFAATFAGLRALPGVEVLTHGVNLGKGAALQTGFNAVLTRHPAGTGVVTADADGQHDQSDVVRIAATFQDDPSQLVLGVRSFGAGTPLRSRIGNIATRALFRLLIGRWLTDTQTGLRGIPAALLPRLLQLSSQRYEFEMDMLLLAARTHLAFREVPIATIYIAGNRESHFQPLYDSFRIYFLLFRFALASLASTVVDIVVFLTVLPLGGSFVGAHVAGRAVSGLLNFVLVSRFVFRSGRDWPLHLAKFALWVPILGSTSYWLQAEIHEDTTWPEVAIKLVVETALFVVNFLVQRDVIFTSSRRGNRGTG